MNYYIFRHGETYFTKNNLPYFNEQVESATLLPEGIPIIKKLAEKLKGIPIELGFTSPYKRCIRTSNIVNNITGIDFKVDKRLHDFNAESINEMVNRLKSFYEELKEKDFENVAICTHGYPIAVLRSLIIKEKFKLEDLNSYPNPGILLEIKNKNLNLIDFN